MMVSYDRMAEVYAPMGTQNTVKTFSYPYKGLPMSKLEELDLSRTIT